MTQIEIANKIKTILLEKIVNCDIVSLSDSESLVEQDLMDELHLTQLDIIKLIIEVENEFDIFIHNDELESFKNINNISAYVIKNIN